MTPSARGAASYVAGLALVAATTACGSQGGASPAPTATAEATASRVEVRKLPVGHTDPAAWVRSELASLGPRRTKALVYVGAVWCEPCKHLKQAAEAGQLDAALPGLVLLELDLDRDRPALEAMGCTSRMIPVLAVPTDDGQCTERRIAGAIKGPEAVAWLTPKIRALID